MFFNNHQYFKKYQYIAFSIFLTSTCIPLLVFNSIFKAYEIKLKYAITPERKLYVSP